MKIKPRNPVALRKPARSNMTRDVWNKEEKFPRELNEKLLVLQPYINNNQDLVCRHLRIHAIGKDAAILYIKGLVDTVALNQDVIDPLISSDPLHPSINDKPLDNIDRLSEEKLLKLIAASLLHVGQVSTVDSAYDAIHSLFDGLTLLLIDGVAASLILDIRGGVIRGLTEPIMDRTVCGPREGFHENLTVNLAIIRRKLRDPNLVVEKMTVGERSRNDVAMLYVSDIASPEIVAEVRKRLQAIDIDAILSSGYINQLIEDHPFTPFPLERVIERGDTAAAELLEGRVVILVNESPLAIVFPALFIEMFQASEDYFEKLAIGGFWRIFRFIAFIIAYSLPALYIALLSHQQELLPLTLLVSLAQARAEVPFPVLVEVLILELIIQLVIEAGLRLPSPLGQTIGVVTGIILGQAAISARLASPAMILVIAMTTIANFAIPNFCMAMTTRFLRLPMILLSAAFGIFGFSLGWLLLFIHLASLESMTVPYMSPLIPMRYQDLKDAFFRGFIFNIKKRPVSIPHQDQNRQHDRFKKGGIS